MFKDTPMTSSFSVKDLAETKQFYGETLGLTISEQAEGFLNLSMNGGGSVFIYPKPNHTAATFTVLYFMTDDIVQAVKDLSDKGIATERYEGMEQDENGIVTNDDGSKIAWFTDPSDNVLAVLETPAQ